MVDDHAPATADRYRHIKAVCENATVAFFIMDEGQRCTYMNPAAERLTGFTLAEVQGRALHDVMHHTRPDGRPYPRSECPIDRALPRRSQERGEEVFVHRDGTFYPVAYAVSPIREEGAIVGMIVEVRDIAQEKRAEHALREQARTLETINRINTSLAAELDLDRLVQAVTDAGTELSGARFGAFFYNVLNEQGEAYMLYTLSGAPREAFAKFPMPRNTAVFGPTFRGEGVVRLDDVTKDPRYGRNAPRRGMPKGHLPVRSYLAVPVVSRSGEVLGGLFFGHERPGVFTERAERIVTGIAVQAAIAIDNARLYQSLRRELAERRRMEEALRARTAELDVIMQTVPAMLWVAHDPGARRITGSRYAAELLRVCPEGNQSLSAPSDERPRHFRVLRDGVELAEEELPVQRAAGGEEVRGEELQVVFEDGDSIHEIVNASPVRDADGTVIGAVGAAIDITARKQAEEQRELLIEELNHRVKNTLATVRSMAAYTLETTPEPERFREAFEGRLSALASAHTLLTRGNWHGASLRDLVQEELAPYRPDGGAGMLAIDGSDITLAPPAALALGMVLHELATNAAKYGALSRPSGRVEIAWEAVDGPAARRLHLRWTESGGPPVSPPTRRGFGSTVIERSLTYQFDGLAELEFHRDGVRCRIELPLARARARRGQPTAAQETTSTP